MRYPWFQCLILFLALAIVMGVGSGNSAMAGTVQIGNGAAGSDPTGQTAPLDPKLVGDGTDISIWLHGSAGVTDKILLAILLPNDTTDVWGGSDPLGTITLYSKWTGPSTGTGSSAFTGTGFGLGTGSATYQSNGFWGAISTASNNKLADFLGADFSNSLSTPNFAGFDTSLGITANDFGVYTLAITTGALNSNSKSALVDISIPDGLPEGAIVVALTDQGDSVPWTNAGGVTTPGPGPGPQPVPEPSALLLLGTGLGALGLAAWRRRK